MPVSKNEPFCPYCAELRQGFLEIQEKNWGNRILFESKDFVIFPALGPLVEGNVLIVTKKHYVGIGSMSPRLYPKLETLKERVRTILKSVYGSTIFFEHGAVSDVKRGGCCIEHAHLQAVPVAVDLVDEIAKDFPYQKIYDFKALKNLYDSDQPYVYWESITGERYAFKVSPALASQFVRRLIAEKIGLLDTWNWREYPKFDMMNRTLKKLRGKFD